MDRLWWSVMRVMECVGGDIICLRGLSAFLILEGACIDEGDFCWWYILVEKGIGHRSKISKIIEVVMNIGHPSEIKWCLPHFITGSWHYHMLHIQCVWWNVRIRTAHDYNKHHQIWASMKNIENHRSCNEYRAPPWDWVMCVTFHYRIQALPHAPHTVRVMKCRHDSSTPSL